MKFLILIILKHLKKLWNQDSITVVLGEGFQPLGLFCDIHSKNNNFPTLIFGHPRPSQCSYQKIAQAKLTNVHRKFAYHIINIYFITIKILLHFIFFFLRFVFGKKIY
jgi:hypothetical protein